MLLKSWATYVLQRSFILVKPTGQHDYILDYHYLLFQFITSIKVMQWFYKQAHNLKFVQNFSAIKESWFYNHPIISGSKASFVCSLRSYH